MAPSGTRYGFVFNAPLAGVEREYFYATCESAMRRVPRSEYPFWVKFSIWGAPDGYVRPFLIFFIILSLLCGILSVAAAFYTGWHILMIGSGMIGAAVPYALAMNWIDNYGSWTEEDVGQETEWDED